MRAFTKALGLIVVFVIAAFAQGNVPDSLSSEIQLRTYLKQNEVPLNKEVVYYVELSWQGNLNRFHVLEISDPVLTNLKLRGSGSSNRFYLDKNKNPHSVKKITFYFTPLEMGMAYVDGITIKYQDMKTKEVGRLISERLPVKIVEPVNPPNRLDLGKILVIGLILFFLFIILFSLARYFQKRKTETEEEVPSLTLEESFVRDLKEMIHTNDILPEKRFTHLQQIFDRYLKERFGIPAGSPWHEINVVLQAQGINDDLRKKLEDFFKRGELVKFAGEPVSESELHIFADTVELIFIEMNKRNNSGQRA